MSEGKPSPLPWHTGTNNPDRVFAAHGEPVAHCDPRHKGFPIYENNARLIVEAVNSHAALTARVAELEGLTRELSEMAGRVTGWEKHGATLYLDADFLRRVKELTEQKP